MVWFLDQPIQRRNTASCWEDPRSCPQLRPAIMGSPSHTRKTQGPTLGLGQHGY